MKLFVYSSSQSFHQFLERQLDTVPLWASELPEAASESDSIHLVHISSMRESCHEWLKKLAQGKSEAMKIAICSDRPDLVEMLDCVQLGAKGYCNSHMAGVHFEHMLQLLDNGQSWFPPQMLEQTFQLARQAANPAISADKLEALTQREKEIATAVAEGKSNGKIATQLGISERTVKSHLTNIFRKLELKDRVALVLHLKTS